MGMSPGAARHASVFPSSMNLHKYLAGSDASFPGTFKFATQCRRYDPGHSKRRGDNRRFHARLDAASQLTKAILLGGCANGPAIHAARVGLPIDPALAAK